MSSVDPGYTDPSYAAAPTASVTTARAGFWRRFAAAFIDGILLGIVSGIVLLLGYLWMLWDSEKQTWHDKAANAVVIPAK